MSLARGFMEAAAVDDFEDLIEVERAGYSPGPTGTRVHQSLARTRIVRGGLGSGKTRCATEHVNALALEYPGSLHLIGRFDLPALKETTQREFLREVVSPETVAGFNVNDNKLYYKNGSEVIFRQLKDPADMKSLQLTSYLIDEADENPSEDIWDFLDDRLRQTFSRGGRRIFPPYVGMLVLNPCDEDHWIYKLAHRTDIDLEDFRFSTYENEKNLPEGYIENLLRKLPPWEVERLIHGHWGRVIRGKPVYHGFTHEKHVKVLKVREDLPIYRGWDFGFNRPAVSWAQLDPITGRYYKLRELLGSQIYLPDFVQEVKRIHQEFGSHPTMDFGDPHGADKKDNAESSIEYLRNHHNIYVNYRREVNRTGMDEIQQKIITSHRLHADSEEQAPLFLIDHSCRISIAAYAGGYHRDEHGVPYKDGYYDHLPDTDKYIIVNTMNRHLAAKRKKKRYMPRNLYTGY